MSGEEAGLTCASVQPYTVLSLPNVASGTLDSIDEVRSRGGEFILQGGLSDPVCSQLNDVTEENDAPVFGKLPDGSWLIFDPRMTLGENTLEHHIPDGGGLVRSVTALRTKCANAPRSMKSSVPSLIPVWHVAPQAHPQFSLN
jgi:hypothetical protein